MQEKTTSLAHLDDLRTYVHRQLCERENLLAEQFGLKEAVLMTRGRPCGMQFSVKGPRSIRLGAIWAADQNVINFYDTQGERYLKVRLEGSVEMPNLGESGGAEIVPAVATAGL